MYMCMYVRICMRVCLYGKFILFKYCHSRSEAIEQSENLLLISALLYSTVYVSFDFSIGIVRYSLLHIKTEILCCNYTSTSGVA